MVAEDQSRNISDSPVLSGSRDGSISLALCTLPYFAISVLMPPRTVPNGFSVWNSLIPASII